MENAVQILGQITIHIAFSKLTGSLLWTANRLKALSPILTWIELKKESCMQYSIISSNNHAAQSFTWLEQGPHELLEEYLHGPSELQSKIYHTSDMSRILVVGINHYAVVYGINCMKLKYSIMGHWSTQWKTMEEWFRDIHNISAGY